MFLHDGRRGDRRHAEPRCGDNDRWLSPPRLITVVDPLLGIVLSTLETLPRRDGRRRSDAISFEGVKHLRAKDDTELGKYKRADDV